jgi:hypothetical protein
MRPVAAVLAVPVLVAVALTLFVWPQARLQPRELPVGVVGPPRVAATLDRGDALDVHAYASRAAAAEAIRDRDVYAAVVLEDRGVTLLLASAASPTVAQLLQQALAPTRVVDVVPADPDDPRGAALSSSVLPLVLAGIVSAGLVARTTRPGLAQVGALAAAAALTGLAAVAIAQGWLEVLSGPWLANAGVLALTVFAIASVGAGLFGLLGPAGLVLTAVLMVLVGNPFSGVPTAPELLPEPAHTIGQLLPPGAGGQLLRSVAFFDGAGGLSHVIVLLAWVAVGLAAIAAAAARAPRRGAVGRLTPAPHGH